ncbi:hypothetical protein P9869_06490 [Streptomyces ossamyceticus]|nr:hypothetical protein [Streptomyces ossamyceticus]
MLTRADTTTAAGGRPVVRDQGAAACVWILGERLPGNFPEYHLMP